MTLSLDTVSDPAFWRSLAPLCALEGSAALPHAHLRDTEATLHDLWREGYAQLDTVFEERDLAALRSLLDALDAHAVPLAFVFVYDAPWALYEALDPWLRVALGDDYQALPDFWAWRIEANDDARGWGPHRDRVRPAVDADGRPLSLTVWITLTDATPLNGCIYALPAHLDPCFAARSWNGPRDVELRHPQDLRALPASAGTVLAWNQNLLHWGGRASRRGRHPRMSLSAEFQRGDRTPFNPPLRAPAARPSFETRLGLVAQQLLQYRHMHPLDAHQHALAQALHERWLFAQP